MIINKLRLKITGTVVLVLSAIIIVYLFWPTKTQIEDENTRDLEARTNAQYPEAEELYRTALIHKEQVNSRDDRDYIMVVDSCQRILRQYPDSPQAEKAKELLQDVPEQYRRQYEKEMTSRYSSKPAVRKSRPLRRRAGRPYDEWINVTDEELSPSD